MTILCRVGHLTLHTHVEIKRFLLTYTHSSLNLLLISHVADVVMLLPTILIHLRKERTVAVTFVY